MNDPYAPGQRPPQYAEPPQYGAPPHPPRRRGRRGTVIGLVLIAAIVVFIGIAGYLAGQSDPDTAAVGDCVALEGSSNVRVVKCTDPDSSHKVAGKVPNKTQTQFNVGSRSICKPFPDAKSAFWKGEVGGEGYVLCLAPVK